MFTGACSLVAGVDELSSGNGRATGGQPNDVNDLGRGGEPASSDAGRAGAAGTPPVAACATDQADCNGLAEDGCEVTLSSDVNHCGRCQRACFAGACEQSRCQPFLVTEGQEDITSLSADNKHVYWMTGSAADAEISVERAGKLMRAAADGSRGDVAIASNYYVPNFSNATMTGDTTTLFWAQRSYDHNYIYALDKIGTGVVRRILYRQGVARVINADPRQILVDVAAVFYAGLVEVGVVSKQGSASRFQTYQGNGDLNRSIATDDNYFFMLTPSTGEIRKEKKDGTQIGQTPPSWATEQLGGIALTTESNDPFVYWVVPSTGEIRRALRGDATGQPTVFFATESAPLQLVVDNEFVYWISPASGELIARPKQGAGNNIVLAKAQAGLRILQASDQAVYWSVGKSSIYGIAKPLATKVVQPTSASANASTLRGLDPSALLSTKTHSERCSRPQR